MGFTCISLVNFNFRLFILCVFFNLDAGEKKKMKIVAEEDVVEKGLNLAFYFF